MSLMRVKISFVLWLESGFGTVYTFVDLIFCRIWSRWPFAVATDFGKCLVTLDSLRAGQDEKLLCLMAANQVELTGLKQAA